MLSSCTVGCHFQTNNRCRKRLNSDFWIILFAAIKDFLSKAPEANLLVKFSIEQQLFKNKKGLYQLKPKKLFNLRKKSKNLIMRIYFVRLTPRSLLRARQGTFCALRYLRLVTKFCWLLVPLPNLNEKQMVALECSF